MVIVALARPRRRQALYSRPGQRVAGTASSASPSRRSRLSWSHWAAAASTRPMRRKTGRPAHQHPALRSRGARRHPGMAEGVRHRASGNHRPGPVASRAEESPAPSASPAGRGRGAVMIKQQEGRHSAAGDGGTDDRLPSTGSGGQGSVATPPDGGVYPARYPELAQHVEPEIACVRNTPVTDARLNFVNRTRARPGRLREAAAARRSAGRAGACAAAQGDARRTRLHHTQLDGALGRGLQLQSSGLQTSLEGVFEGSVSERL